MSTDNCRKFLIDFAAQNNFDPLVSANWNNIKYKEIMNQVSLQSPSPTI